MTNSVCTQTARIISNLYNDGNPDKGALAGLRSASSIQARQAVVIWSMVLAGIDDKDLKNDNLHQIRCRENAIFMTLKCYAIYQQANEQNVYTSAKNDAFAKENLFCALSLLRNDEKSRNAANRRISAILSSSNYKSVVNGIIHLLQILKGKHKYLQIDYPRLAEDLYQFQVSPSAARRVCLHWGEQYYSVNKDNSEDKEN